MRAPGPSRASDRRERYQRRTGGRGTDTAPEGPVEDKQIPSLECSVYVVRTKTLAGNGMRLWCEEIRLPECRVGAISASTLRGSRLVLMQVSSEGESWKAL